jgi:taurine dioxygenase
MQKFEVTPIQGPAFGATVQGLDLARPLEAENLARLHEVFNRHSLLVFRDQQLTPAEQIAFTRRFGDIEIHVQSNYHLKGFPEIFVISNLIEDGRLIGGVDCALTWHSDSSYMKIPSLGSMLYALEVPPAGADTSFVCTYASHDELPAALKSQIAGRKAVHSYLRLQQKQFPERPLTAEQRQRAPDVAHPIAPLHPVTGRRSLFLGGDVIAGVEGLPQDEGIAVMREILEFATRPDYVYRHTWNVGDLVFWDNRCTLHQGSRYDKVNHRRRMHRSTLAGTAAPAG